MATGPDAALSLVDQLVATRTLERYHLLPSVRGDLLDRLGRHDEAAAEFDRAAALATNAQERALSEERASVEPGPDGPPGHRPSPVAPSLTRGLARPCAHHGRSCSRAGGSVP